MHLSLIEKMVSGLLVTLLMQGSTHAQNPYRILALQFMATPRDDPRGYFPADERESVSPSVEQCIVGDILAIAHQYAAFTESKSESSHSHTMLASCGVRDCRANRTHSPLCLRVRRYPSNTKSSLRRRRTVILLVANGRERCLRSF